MILTFNKGLIDIKTNVIMLTNRELQVLYVNATA